MTIIPAAQEYTDKDFASINARLEHLLLARFPEWTDFIRASWQNIKKELFAFSLDILTFYQDEQVRETRFAWALKRRSMIALCRLISYVLDGAGAATADVVFSIPSATAGDVVIPLGTSIRTESPTDPIRFQTTAAATILAGGTSSAAVSAEHSEIQQDMFEAQGLADEEFVLSQSPFLDGSLMAAGGGNLDIGGDTWTEVEHFLDNGPTDKVFTVTVDENDKATIKVGDGSNGAIPAAGAIVTADYKTGGGAVGNVEAASLKKVEGGPWYDTLGNPVQLSVAQALAASGGTDRESVEQARIRAPRSLRVLNRSIARTDFEDLAVQVTGVSRALMLTKNQLAAVEEGRGWMWLIPTGGGTASAALKTAVYNYIAASYPWSLIFDWEVRDTDLRTVNVAATVYLTADAVDADVVTAVRAALTAWFAVDNDDGTENDNVRFGYYYQRANPVAGGAPVSDPKVALSAIANLINDTAGVRRLGTPGDGEGITLNGAQDDVDLLDYEFPSAGTLILTNGDTGANLYTGAI